MFIKTFLHCKNSCISCGINSVGELFLGDDKSGYNMPDTKGVIKEEKQILIEMKLVIR